MREQLCNRLLEQLVIERRREQHRLIVVMRVDEVLLEEPTLNRRERDWTTDRRIRLATRTRRINNRSELCDRLVLKDLFGCDPDACQTRSRHDLNAENRIATQLEEVIVRAHHFDTQHLRPNLRDRLLGARARGNELLLGPLSFEHTSELQSRFGISYAVFC